MAVKLIKITEADIDLTKNLILTGVFPTDVKIKERISRVILNKMYALDREKESEKYYKMERLNNQLWGNDTI